MRILLALVLILAASSVGRSAPVPECTYGRWAMSLGLNPFAEIADGGFVAVISSDRTAKLSWSMGNLPVNDFAYCPRQRVKYAATPAGTRVAVRWKGCDLGQGVVKLVGVVKKDCSAFKGRVRSNLFQTARARPFLAYPSVCGDLVVDRGLSEACEPPGFCSSLLDRCDPDCRCRQ